MPRVTASLRHLAGITGAMIISVLPNAAAASEVTISTEIRPIFRNGDLEGCALNFEVAREDNEYQQGALIYISGSLNYVIFANQDPQFGLKLGIKSTDDDAKFEAPTTAYLLNEYSTNKADFVTSFDGETKGFRVFAFKAGEESVGAAMEAVAKSGKIMVGYSLKGGSMSAPFPVDLRMRSLNLDDPGKSEIDDSGPKRWLECLHKATEHARDRGN